MCLERWKAQLISVVGSNRSTTVQQNGVNESIENGTLDRFKNGAETKYSNL